MKLGFLGSGKMASALAHGVVKSGVFKGDQIIVSDVHKSAASKLAKSVEGHVAANNRELANNCDVLLLCVKPADSIHALKDACVPCAGKLIISIVAGLPIHRLEEATVAAARVVRVMPNTPALVGHGAAAYALGRAATEDDAALTEKIFGSVGLIVRVKEELLNVVTGLSGSGPAFIYTVIEALADGGVLMGLPRDLALKLATQTVCGAASMVRETHEHPAVLRDHVTSPGGTTIAGLEALEHGGLRAALISAVRAATERSFELGEVK